MDNTIEIPTVDLTPFLKESSRDDENEKKRVVEIISKACSETGFFQIVNHGLPLETTNQALELSKAFFGLSDEEKLKSGPRAQAQLPSGYCKQPQHSSDKNEYFVVVPPSSDSNVDPQNPPRFREVLEETFLGLTKIGLLVEDILNECLGLPPNFLKEYNNDRTWDLMVALRYFPVTETENTGIAEHEDGNCFSFVLQDEVGGLEVLINKEWVPIIPSQGTIVVNIGDVIQVLSNNKFKSATHRVVRQKGKDRLSFAYFNNLHGDTWVEPLPKFTQDIGESPKYKPFMFKDYQRLRIKNKTHPPSKPEDVISITHYAITNI